MRFPTKRLCLVYILYLPCRLGLAFHIMVANVPTLSHSAVGNQAGAGSEPKGARKLVVGRQRQLSTGKQATLEKIKECQGRQPLLTPPREFTISSDNQ